MITKSLLLLQLLMICVSIVMWSAAHATSRNAGSLHLAQGIFIFATQAQSYGITSAQTVSWGRLPDRNSKIVSMASSAPGTLSATSHRYSSEGWYKMIACHNGHIGAPSAVLLQTLAITTPVLKQRQRFQGNWAAAQTHLFRQGKHE